MKLSEALILRADYQKRLEQLKLRLVNNAKIQDGDEVAEAPDLLLDQVEVLLNNLKQLIQRINKTNLQTEFAPGLSLTDALAERDVLMLKRNIYQELLNETVVRQDRFTRSEVKFRITINIAQTQKQADELAQSYRELDTKIQEVNWRTELPT